MKRRTAVVLLAGLTVGCLGMAQGAKADCVITRTGLPIYFNESPPPYFEERTLSSPVLVDPDPVPAPIYMEPGFAPRVIESPVYLDRPRGMHLHAPFVHFDMF